MPPSDCMFVGGMDGVFTEGVWVGVGESGGTAVVGAAGSVVAFNGPWHPAVL